MKTVRICFACCLLLACGRRELPAVAELQRHFAEPPLEAQPLTEPLVEGADSSNWTQYLPDSLFRKALASWPGSMKAEADSLFADGVTPVLPWYIRYETWAEQADVWTAYLARTAYMLQQGREPEPGLEKDLRTREDILYIHRILHDGEFYWVSNPQDKFMTFDLSLRTTGLEPRLWDPETGREADVFYHVEGKRTVVRWQARPHDAVFIVFSGKARKSGREVPSNEWNGAQILDGFWTVSFQEGRGAPASAQFTTLLSLSKVSDPGVKFFSGTATYSHPFRWTGDRAMLDLGQVYDMAEVLVNGKKVRTLWMKPYIVEITGFVQPGENSLEVRVTNPWHNQLIRDSLLPAGLVGPVRIFY